MQFRRKFTKHKNFAFQFLNVSWIEDHFNQLDSEDPDMYWAHDHEEHGEPDDVPKKIMICLGRMIIMNNKIIIIFVILIIMKIIVTWSYVFDDNWDPDDHDMSLAHQLDDHCDHKDHQKSLAQHHGDHCYPYDMAQIIMMSWENSHENHLMSKTNNHNDNCELDDLHVIGTLS